MHKTSPHLDGEYAAFGKVIEGLEIVDKIANVRTDYSDRPLEKQQIKSMTVGNLRRRLPGTGEVLNEKRIANGNNIPRLSFSFHVFIVSYKSFLIYSVCVSPKSSSFR